MFQTNKIMCCVEVAQQSQNWFVKLSSNKMLCCPFVLWLWTSAHDFKTRGCHTGPITFMFYADLTQISCVRSKWLSSSGFWTCYKSYKLFGICHWACLLLLGQISEIWKHLTTQAANKLDVSLILSCIDYCNSLSSHPQSTIVSNTSEQCWMPHPEKEEIWPHYLCSRIASLAPCFQAH